MIERSKLIITEVPCGVPVNPVAAATETPAPVENPPVSKHLRVQKFTAEIWVKTDIQDAAIVREAVAAGHDQFFCPEGILQKVKVCKIRRLKK
jgi:hypothetical protein